MVADLLDIIRSLVSLMDEETSVLKSGGSAASVAEIAAAKLRLTGMLEAEVARQDRQQEGWREALPIDDREELTAATDALQRASRDNADILRRQIELSIDIMDSIAAEAKRLRGARRQTYGATGGLFRTDMPTPISVNTSL